MAFVQIKINDRAYLITADQVSTIHDLARRLEGKARRENGDLSRLTLFSVPLNQKIKAIKLVRQITGFMLKESKHLCDEVQAGKPQVIALVDYNEIQSYVKKFQEIECLARGDSPLDLLARCAE